MEKVVILARVSSDRQDYERQVNELTEFCNTMKWEVVRVFANKVSGAKKRMQADVFSDFISRPRNAWNNAKAQGTATIEL